MKIICERLEINRLEFVGKSHSAYREGTEIVFFPPDKDRMSWGFEFSDGRNITATGQVICVWKVPKEEVV